jgi:RimJ/RimL family protein N-acetyltransferase
MRATTAPVVESHPVILRPVDQSDAQAWFEFAGDPTVMQYTSSDVRSLQDLRPLIERANAPEPGSPIQFAVCMRADARFVGIVGFHTISVPNRTAEITYALHPSFWGQGIASAICAATASWGFAEQGFVRIQATVLEPNVASIRVLQRCGFLLEGKLRNFRMVRGEPRDYLLYSLVPSATPGANPSIERTSSGKPEAALMSNVDPTRESLMFDSISHVALVVADPARTALLFKNLFPTKIVNRVDADGHDETFFNLGNTWFVLVKGAGQRERVGDHIAFHVTKAELQATTEKLKAMHLEFILARSDSSLYFFDYDNHVFELDTTDINRELNRGG